MVLEAGGCKEWFSNFIVMLCWCLPEMRENMLCACARMHSAHDAIFYSIVCCVAQWYRNRALKAQVDSYALVVHQNAHGPSPIRSGDIEL